VLRLSWPEVWTNELPWQFSYHGQPGVPETACPPGRNQGL